MILCLGVRFSQGSPEAQGPISHGQHWSRHPPPFQVSEQAGPQLGGLAIAIFQGNHFATVREYAHDHQTRQTRQTILSSRTLKYTQSAQM